MPRAGTIDGQLSRFHQVEIDQRLRELFGEVTAFPVLGQQRLRFSVQEGA
jgi:hypothetical protein